MEEKRMYKIDKNTHAIQHMLKDYYKDTQHNQESDVQSKQAIDDMLELTTDILYELNEEKHSTILQY